jgi:hypothetical protein
MVPIGNLFRRMIYCYEFPDNHVYVGLTYNEKKRKSEHLTDGKGPVWKYKLKTNLEPIYKKLSEYLDEQSAKKFEQETIDKYKVAGWKILNSTKAGALGGNSTKWTKEKIKEVAKLYNKKIDFQKSPEYYTAYSAASKHGWIDEVCAHMKYSKTYWNKEKCLLEAKKYQTRVSFMKNCGGAYNFALKNNFLDEICSHMTILLKKWTKEECNAEAKKYSYRVDFQKKSHSAYLFALRKGWLNEICSHMGKKLKYWDYDKCKEEALKYKKMKDFRTKSGSAYNHARDNGFIKDISNHLE